MTCKHNWHFVEGVFAKRIRCTRCADVRFVDEPDPLSLSLAHGYTIAKASLAPSRFVIMDGGTKEVMVISKEGVTTNPEFSVDEGAKYVIKALDNYIKAMVQKEYERGVVDGRQIQVQKEVERRMRNPATEDSSVAREWNGLSQEEVEAYDDWADFQVGCGRQTLFDMVRDIESKLKGRNT